GRRDRGRGDGGGAAAERDVPGGAGQRQSSARAHERQDADELHPDPPGRSSQGRALAVRPHAGPDHVPVQIAAGTNDESQTVDQGALRALQDHQAPGRDARDLQESPAQGAPGIARRRPAMARVAGVDLQREKRGEVAITYIYGLGRLTARRLLMRANIDPNMKVMACNVYEVGRILVL